MSREQFYKKFVLLLEERVEKIKKTSQWGSQRFEKIKCLMSNTDVGELGEHFILSILEESKKFNKVERPSGKRGDYDILIMDKTIEVKTATMDIKQNFQFNGIRYDTKYDFLLLLAISPTDIYYKIVQDVRSLKLSPMAKGSNASFKYTAQPEGLKNIEEIIEDIAQLISR